MPARRILVASNNPAKLRAAAEAFRYRFPDDDVDVAAVSVSSGVADQPASDSETRTGAWNRARGARAAEPDADYWVGIEGGVEPLEDGLIAYAWTAVLDAAGRRGEARTVTLPLPPAVTALVRQGMELGDANDRVFGTVDSKQRGGAFALLTDGRYTREGIYAQALSMALVPLLNPLYRDV